MCRRILLVSIAVGVLIAIAMPFTVLGVRALESQPSLCYTCHEEHAAHAGWLASGAARHHPTCIECHSAPGFAGMLGAQVKGAAHVVAHFTGNFVNPITRADVPNENCAQCHAQNRIEREHRRIRDFPARRCAACHNHKPGARFGESEGHD